MHKRTVLILFSFIIVAPLFSQEKKKTTAFMTLEYLSPAESVRFKSENLINFSFGLGIGLNLKTHFSESSALLYGLELASTRTNLILDGVGVYASFSHFKFPVYYHYSLPLDRKKKHLLNLFLGTKIMIQQGGEISGSGSKFGGTKYSVNNIGGVFPFLTFGFGYDLKFKNNYFVGFEAGYTMGFINTIDAEYIDNKNHLNFSSKRSHFNVKVLFPINPKN